MNINSEADDIKRKLDEERQQTVSVALFGQPGAGKSSLINKIIGRKIASVGVETDKTVDAAYYKHNGINFVDLPGYGTSSFPKDTYFDKFNIEELDLFLCVTSGKLHQADTEFFQELSRLGKVCIFVINKHDELWEEGVEIEELENRKNADIEKHVGSKVNSIFTSCRLNTGLDKLNTEIQDNLEGAKKERWARSAKAYSHTFLISKKNACEKYVSLAAATAAVNGVNPVPGLDVSLDLAVLMKLFSEIRDCYGLDEDHLSDLKKSTVPVVSRLANNVVKYAAKEGLLMLLKRYAGKQVAKSLSKYIPFVGQAVAAGIGYAITSNAGASYLDDCHELATKILDQKLGA